MTTSVGEEEARTGWVANDSTFGARLALIRQRMHWGNVKEAADACGLPAESWRRWERDGRAPRDVVDIASTISERTGCDFGWLLAGSRLTSSGGSHPIGRYHPTGTTRPSGRRPASRPARGGPPPGPGRTSRIHPPIAA